MVASFGWAPHPQGQQGVDDRRSRPYVEPKIFASGEIIISASTRAYKSRAGIRWPTRSNQQTVNRCIYRSAADRETHPLHTCRKTERSASNQCASRGQGKSSPWGHTSTFFFAPRQTASSPISPLPSAAWVRFDRQQQHVRPLQVVSRLRVVRRWCSCRPAVSAYSKGGASF